MKFFTIITAALLFISGTESKIDFGNSKIGENWNVINDGVMGGLSEGKVELKENSILFTGNISLKNYGGFTSFKSPFSNFDLSEAKEVSLRYRSKGQEVAISLENSKAFFQPYYKLNLEDTDGEWLEVKLPVNGFKEYNLGQVTSTAISEQFLGSVQRVGFIAAEKKEGEFEFEVDYIIFH